MSTIAVLGSITYGRNERATSPMPKPARPWTKLPRAIPTAARSQDQSIVNSATPRGLGRKCKRLDDPVRGSGGNRSERTLCAGGGLACLQAGANCVKEGADSGTEREQRNEGRDGDAGQDESVFNQALPFLALGDVAPD